MFLEWHADTVFLRGRGSSDVRAHRYARAAMQAVYYRAPDGSEPLTQDLPHLPYPHSSQVEGELRELRCHFGRELYLVLYRRSRNLVLLLHIFRKDRGKISQDDIALAKARWRDFKARMDAERRRPPRAAGRDAP